MNNKLNKTTSAIIIIGNEILSGRTQEVNLSYLSIWLNKLGVRVEEVRIIPDIENKIVNCVNELRKKFNYVFTTGGIGPTHDDITSECVAKACGVAFGTHPEAFEILEAHYGKEEFNAPRRKMAMTPQGAELIPNPVSAAPGFIIDNIYVMAGVPRIMQAMVDHVVPSLAGGALVKSENVPCFYPESKIAEGLGDIQKKFPDVDIGSYPYFKDGKTGVNVVLRSSNEESLTKAKEDVEDMISSI